MYLVIVLLLLTCWLLATWIVLAGDREQDIVDEEPTLNTRSDR